MESLHNLLDMDDEESNFESLAFLAGQPAALKRLRRTLMRAKMRLQRRSVVRAHSMGAQKKRPSGLRSPGSVTSPPAQRHSSAHWGL